jgi:hypothetical protein
VALILLLTSLSFSENVKAESDFDEFKITNVNRSTYQVYMKGNPYRLRLGEWLVTVLRGGKTCFLKVNMIKNDWIVGEAKTCRYKELIQRGQVARYYIDVEAEEKRRLAEKKAKENKRKLAKKKKKRRKKRKRKANWYEHIGFSFYRNTASDVDLEGGVKGGGLGIEGQDVSEGAFGVGIEYHKMQVLSRLFGYGLGVNYEFDRTLDSRVLRFSNGNRAEVNYKGIGPSFTMLIAFLEANISSRNGKFYGSAGVNWSKASLSRFESNESASGGIGWQIGAGFKGFSRRSFFRKLNIEISYRKYEGERTNDTQDFSSTSMDGFQLRFIYHPFKR